MGWWVTMEWGTPFEQDETSEPDSGRAAICLHTLGGVRTG